MGDAVISSHVGDDRRLEFSPETRQTPASFAAVCDGIVVRRIAIKFDGIEIRPLWWHARSGQTDFCRRRVLGGI